MREGCGIWWWGVRHDINFKKGNFNEKIPMLERHLYEIILRFRPVVSVYNIKIDIYIFINSFINDYPYKSRSVRRGTTFLTKEEIETWVS